jgi:hypothetical protein
MTDHFQCHVSYVTMTDHFQCHISYVTMTHHFQCHSKLKKGKLFLPFQVNLKKKQIMKC